MLGASLCQHTVSRHVARNGKGNRGSGRLPMVVKGAQRLEEKHSAHNQQLQRQQTVPQDEAGPSRRQLLGAGLASLAMAGVAAAAGPQPAQAAVGDPIAPEGKTEVVPRAAVQEFTQAQKQVLQNNLRTQRQNNAPLDFPNFVREGYDMTIVADGYQVSPEGLIYKDFVEGQGELPVDGQEVTFDYTAYNESAGLIDSSYRKGQPARTRLGIQGLIPGFELGIKTMRPGGKRRVVVPPELGPPTGPATFFSAKQFEVFDVELRTIKTCRRQQVGMFSNVVCE